MKTKISSTESTEAMSFLLKQYKVLADKYYAGYAEDKALDEAQEAIVYMLNKILEAIMEESEHKHINKTRNEYDKAMRLDRTGTP